MSIAIELRYEIPKGMKVSTNTIYAGVHWTIRKAVADFYHLIVKQDCGQLPELKEKVDLEFVFSWKSALLDSSNCSFMAKCIEDGFRKHKFIKDDSPQYVGKFSCESIPGESDAVNIFIKSHHEI